MVNFKDANVRVRVAIGEGVEACSEENVLSDPPGDGVGEHVFGVTASGDEEGAERRRERLLQFGCGFLKLGKVLLAENGDRNWVIEDEGLSVVELMRGSAQSYT
jgi:hypothetical protein